MRRLAIVAGSVLMAALALTGKTRHAGATGQDAERALGFENTDDWEASGGSILGLTPIRTQGDSGLLLLADGYTSLQSRLVGPLGDVSGRVSVDLRIPDFVPDPYWQGDVQLYVSAPSVGIHNTYVGRVDLGGRPRGAFTEIGFDLGEGLRDTLSGQISDVSFEIVLNVPANTDPYVLDNLQVSATIPGRSTFSSSDIPRILGFESESDWSGPSSTHFVSSPKTHGLSSLAVATDGYRVITSVPMTSIGPIAESFTLDVLVPSLQPSPYWWGSLGLFVSIPSEGVNNQHLGEHQLTGLPTDSFTTLAFSPSQELRDIINNGGYSDLRFSVSLNVPDGSGTYHLDRLSVGTVTNPPAAVTSSVRDDLVGRTSSGVMTVQIGGYSDTPSVSDALIKVKAEDEGCIPSPTTACRYLVNQVRIVLGAFTLDNNYAGARIGTAEPFRVTVGGNYGMTVWVPPETMFIGEIFESDLLLGVGASALAITIDPSGDGILGVYGTLSGALDGHEFSLSGVVFADSPLLNRPPVADAGPAQVATSSGSSCEAFAQVDGSGSTDPDFNLQRLAWYWRGALYGIGPNPQLRFSRSGSYLIELIATDDALSTDSDSVVVDVSLPTSCGAIDL